jgi:DNA-binding transcriptional MocR family regulator
MSKVLLYGPHQGYAPLRQSIASWLYDVYRPAAGEIGPERICITGGASQNLANITMKFADPTYTRCIFMVEPTYFLACPVFEDCGFQGKLRGVPEDLEDGLDLQYLRTALEQAEKEAQKKCAETGQPDVPTFKTGPTYPHIFKYLIYLCPTYSNPSGKTMSTPLRERLIKLAREFDALLITDDVYDFLSWPEDPSKEDGDVAAVPPRLVDVDRSMEGCSKYGNAISNGSFSKLIGPGVRVGWAEGTPAAMDLLANV